MRRRRRVLGRAGPARAPTDAETVVVVFAFVVAAAVAAQTLAVQQNGWPMMSNDSVMHNVSTMIERLLDNYDMRLRPQFGGRHISQDQQCYKRFKDLVSAFSVLFCRVIHG